MFKITNKVRLINTEITGTVANIRSSNIWGVDFDEYLIKYDDEDLVPQEDWHPESDLEPIETLTAGYSAKCECGVDKVMKNGKHSDYCPLYRIYSN